MRPPVATSSLIAIITLARRPRRRTPLSSCVKNLAVSRDRFVQLLTRRAFVLASTQWHRYNRTERVPQHNVSRDSADTRLTMACEMFKYLHAYCALIVQHRAATTAKTRYLMTLCASCRSHIHELRVTQFVSHRDAASRCRTARRHCLGAINGRRPRPRDMREKSYKRRTKQ